MKISDIELVEKLKNGEENAFDELYKRYEKNLLFMAMQLTNNKGDAEDAVQETFVQVLRSIHQLNNPAYLKLWLHRIVSGKCKDIFRRNKTVPVDTSDDKVAMHYVEERMEFLPEYNLRFKSDCDVVKFYINRLPYSQKEVVLLAYFEQMSMQEIADTLNESVGTVKSRLFLAKKVLRTSLASFESREKIHIDFHTLNLEALITASLLEGFQQLTQVSATFSAVPILTKLKSLFATEVGKVTIGVAAISVATTSVVAYDHIQTENRYRNEIQENKMPHAVVSVDDNIINNEEEAYFVLMNWAMNEKQLELRDQSEFEVYKPIYNYLKEHKGAYWESIITTDFDKALEAKFK